MNDKIESTTKVDNGGNDSHLSRKDKIKLLYKQYSAVPDPSKKALYRLQFIKECTEYKKYLIEEKCYEETMFGLLSPQELEDSDMRFINGKWVVPVITRYCEQTNSVYKRGDPIQDYTPKHIRWLEKRALDNANPYEDADAMINKLMQQDV